MPKIAPRALHISKKNWGSSPNPPPPQGEIDAHKYSHYKISNPPFTNPNPRICLELLLEHFIFLNFLGGGPPNTPLPINIHTIKFRI